MMLTKKRIEDLHDGAVAADAVAGETWTASSNDVVDERGNSLFDKDGVKSPAVAQHIAAADPATIVALTNRVLAHEGALEVFRTAILVARTAREAFAACGGVVGGLAPAAVERAATKALDDLFALIQPNVTLTEERYYLLRIDDLDSPGLSLTWQRDYQPEGDETVADGGQSPTFMLSHSLQCTRRQVDLFDPKKALAIPCRIVAGMSKDGRVDLHHRHEIMRHGVIPGSPT